MSTVRIKVPLGINKTIHLKELEDYSWFPEWLRNFQTDFIGYVADKSGIYCVFTQHLKMLSLPVRPMIDLCSGSGQPAIGIFKKSNCFEYLLLTDKFPQKISIHENGILYLQQSRDVKEMEFRDNVYYTMFNAFHHFTDEEKLTIVSEIRKSGSGAFFVEILEPGIFCFLKIVFITLIGSLLLTPFIKPFSFKRFFFTYLIPVNVFTIFVDGIISVFKSRSLNDYRKLFDGEEIKITKLKKGLHSLIVIQLSSGK
jgi:hypothetical protein